MSTKIRAKERDSIIQSLKAGVTPKTGSHHIQVARKLEMKAMIEDIDRIIDGGSSFRLVIGDYGSGKTFFLSLVRSVALQKNLVGTNADLTPDRRIQATGGQARTLYAELMRNLSTRTKPEGGALVNIVERLISTSMSEVSERSCDVESVINKKLMELMELPGGYDFAEVVKKYWQGYDTDNEDLKNNAIKWLRAEYTVKTEARKDLGVRTIIDDSNFYGSLKIMSLLVRQAGYQGLMVNLDEMVNLLKLNSSQARKSNYEQILVMLNDCLQGTSSYLGFVLGGTPEFLMDTRKGLFSYDALQTRLAENNFAKRAGVIDYTSPVISLASLTPEELFVLMTNIRRVFAGGEDGKDLIPDEGIGAFLTHCNEKIGEAYFRTPRNSIKAFLDLLAVLHQSETATWQNLVGEVDITLETNSDLVVDEEDDSEFAGFSL